MARPFIKWVGGKTQLLEQLISIIPNNINSYYEPFVGGGSLFFKLAEKKSFQNAFINDWNSELINAYNVIKNQSNDLVINLQKLNDKYKVNTKEIYLFERDKDPNDLNIIDQATRFIFLNKTGFNGLYRVNKKGKFNVAFGKYENPRIVDSENIEACSKALTNVTITSKDFSEVVNAQVGDVVYFDPPYVPISSTSNFVSYTSNGFSLDDQERLAKRFKDLVNSGVMVIESNSDTSIVREFYKDFEMKVVQAKRKINSKGNKRGSVNELIIVGK